jgi:hypothetical protein
MSRKSVACMHAFGHCKKTRERVAYPMALAGWLAGTDVITYPCLPGTPEKSRTRPVGSASAATAGVYAHACLAPYTCVYD